MTKLGPAYKRVDFDPFEFFHRFSDLEWSEIIALMPSGIKNADQIRAAIEFDLFLYTHNCRSCAIGCVLVGGQVDITEIEHPYRGPWYEFDLQRGHNRLIAAARELMEAYEDMLHPRWDENSDAAASDITALNDSLEEIVKNSEQAIDQLERDKAQMKQWGFKKAGKPVDHNLSILVRQLIDVWARAGGKVGGGNHKGHGGPLVRFLISTAGLVLDEAPTAERARHWIRSYKKMHQTEKTPQKQKP